jgi:hypothetical protein
MPVVFSLYIYIPSSSSFCRVGVVCCFVVALFVPLLLLTERHFMSNDVSVMSGERRDDWTSDGRPERKRSRNLQARNIGCLLQVILSSRYLTSSA